MNANSECNKVHMSERIGQEEKHLLLRELDNLKNLKLTGMHCFTLDLKLILLYVGAFFSYAALIAAIRDERRTLTIILVELYSLQAIESFIIKSIVTPLTRVTMF